MTKKEFMQNHQPELVQYCIDKSTQPSGVAKRLEEFTRSNSPAHHMLIGEMEASLIRLLIKLGQVKKIAEFGTFTGYSALVMAEVLPDDGKVFTVDINPHTTKIAKDYWAMSPHGEKIKLILKPGQEALEELTKSAPFDLVFIDADKNGYPAYLDWAAKNIRSGGIIITDNTLWSGKVLAESKDQQTESIKKHNDLAKNLSGFTKSLLPLRDGMFILVKD